MPKLQARRKFIVSGRVQGVGFRWFVRHWAERLALRGWVCNREDGTLLAEAEGSPESLAELERRLRLGPAQAHVDAVATTVIAPAGEPPVFEIR